MDPQEFMPEVLEAFECAIDAMDAATGVQREIFVTQEALSANSVSPDYHQEQVIRASQLTLRLQNACERADKLRSRLPKYANLFPEYLPQGVEIGGNRYSSALFAAFEISGKLLYQIRLYLNKPIKTINDLAEQKEWAQDHERYEWVRVVAALVHNKCIPDPTGWNLLPGVLHHECMLLNERLKSEDRPISLAALYELCVGRLNRAGIEVAGSESTVRGWKKAKGFPTEMTWNNVRRWLNKKKDYDIGPPPDEC